MEKSLSAVARAFNLSQQDEKATIHISRRPGEYLGFLGETLPDLSWDGSIFEWYERMATTIFAFQPTDLFVGPGMLVLLEHCRSFELGIERPSDSEFYSMVGKFGNGTKIWSNSKHPDNEAWAFVDERLLRNFCVHGFEKSTPAPTTISSEFAKQSYKTDDPNWYAPKKIPDPSLRVRFKKMTPTATIPSASRAGDIGFDLCCDEDFLMIPGNTRKVSTGIQLADMPTKDLEDNCIFLKIEGRSGLALKGVFPSGGIIDPNYRGEIGVVLNAMSTGEPARPLAFKRGDRIAQLVVYKVATAGEIPMEESSEVTETNRGASGFGSSGA